MCLVSVFFALLVTGLEMLNCIVIVAELIADLLRAESHTFEKIVKPSISKKLVLRDCQAKL